MKKRLFCFGLGYSALVFARGLPREGWTVAGTSRGEARRAALRREGVRALPFDGGEPDAATAAAVTGATHLLDSIPPGPDSACPPLDRLAGAVVRAEDLEWIGYLSTTGVYGDRGGAWVDEATPPAPGMERSRRRLAAEEAWLVMHERYGLPVHVFRLAGIYGPGRGVLEQVRRGRARRVVKPGQVFSRIHVDDIAQVLRASMARPNPGAVYNVCDDRPEAPEKTVEYACGLLGAEPPAPIAFKDADLSDMARSFYADNKRVRNDRIKKELGVTLLHPDYRSGMAADLAASRRPSGSPSSVRPSRARSPSRDRR